MGRAGRTYPTLFALLPPTPAPISSLVRVPHPAIALIPLQHGVVGSTVRALVMVRLRHTLGWWLRGSLDAEPLGRLFDLRLDAREVHPAQGHQDVMAVQGGFQGVG